MICCFMAFTFLFFWVPLYYVLRYLWELLQVGDLSKKAVFITGCDSGFGLMLARKCAQNGMHVFAGCLTEQGAGAIETEATMLRGGSLRAVIVDVTKDDSVRRAVEFVEQNMISGIKLWAVVNNAGVFTTYGPDDWCTVEDYKFSLDVNTLGIIRVSQAFKPLIKHSKGRIVSVTSVAGRVSLPYAGPYSVAKFATEAYMDCIRYEMKTFGVSCCILEPGIFKTALLNHDAMKQRISTVWNRLNEDQQQDYGEKFMEFFVTHWIETLDALGSTHVEYVVDSYYHAITAMFPRSRYRCGWDALLVYIPITYLPTELLDLLVKFFLDPKMKPSAVENKKYK
ncbi:Retinol dehydrogenase 7 [Toxocara canis]|uniref:Retinol dehydrogenase 7 n=2 Tax=Toxocara canis TaxID=6265 RepID=A0A0B2V4U2_TOXCA|nr:Retinol dehydrogenase 7 [Toxocara canis]VDM23520.1 unnamed protein product [Toxocara canis]